MPREHLVEGSAYVYSHPRPPSYSPSPIKVASASNPLRFLSIERDVGRGEFSEGTGVVGGGRPTPARLHRKAEVFDVVEYRIIYIRMNMRTMMITSELSYIFVTPCLHLQHR